MSSFKSITVKAALPTGRTFGSRNHSRISAAFSNSPLPIGKNEYDEEYLKHLAESALLGNGGPGDEFQNSGVGNGTINDQGYMFNTVNLNYKDAPDLLTVETGPSGMPASPYIPNISSAPGAIPSNMPAYTGDHPNKSNSYGSGLGGIVSPSETSKLISKGKLGDYILGPIAGQSKSF